MQDTDIAALTAAIAALEGQRATLGDAVLEMALAPLRAKLAGLQRSTGLQRRQVTVLFADVVGSTAMASSLDAEDTLDLLSGTLRRMAEIVEAQGGRVLRFTGDGVKAAFGMDEAREDDPDRAVRAGLAIVAAGSEQAAAARRVHGIADFAVRVGVHTGDVALGAGIDADNTAVGATVHIAARMEQSAPPGALRISHDTWNHVRGLFEFEPQPPLPVKGVAAPMQTYLVRAALDRSAAAVERGLQDLSTPLVGRQAELQRLLDAVSQARQTRQLQALTLLADAGLGKSRLLREFTAALQHGRVMTVRSQPDGLLRPWGLLRSLLATQFAVADTDSADLARRKVVDGLSPWFGEHGERQAQLIGQLSGLDFGDSPHVRGLDPLSLRDQAFAALRAYLQALAAGSGGLPVLVVEDLHWADDGSLDLLQHLQAHAAELPLALIMTGRPALLARRPGWATADTLLQLSPLAAAHSSELAQALLLRLEAVPPKLTELIVGQAEGNPYYMEELVRRLVDDGVIVVGEPHWTVQLERLQAVRLPGTLVGLLQARLDALPAGERLAARQASVIGHVFWDDALQAVDGHAPQALPALQRAAFVKAHATSDFEGTAERQFDHHLLHQVTYDTLLKTERRLGHSAVARWLTQRRQGRGAEFLAMTGEHAERAGDTALAIDCFEQAGHEAKKRFANTAAVAWMGRALGLLGDSAPARQLDLLHELHTIGDTTGDRAAQQAAHSKAAAILERHPDDMRQARLWFCMALLADRLADRVASLPLALKAFELAERCGAAEWAAVAQGQLAWLKQVKRDFAGADEHLEVGLQWAGKIDDPQRRTGTEARLLIIAGVVCMELNRLDDARERYLAALSRGEALGSARTQLSSLINLTQYAARRGLHDEMTQWAERSRALAQSIGAWPQVASAAEDLGRAAALKGDVETSARWYEHSLAIHRRLGDHRQETQLLMRLADSALERGDAPGSLRWCAEARAQAHGLSALLSFQFATIEAHCQMRLGQQDAALATVNTLLDHDQLRGELAAMPASKTILERRACQTILQTLGDPRAASMLEQLHTDVQTLAAALTVAADRDRLIQAHPGYRAIVADYQRRGEPDTAH